VGHRKVTYPETIHKSAFSYNGYTPEEKWGGANIVKSSGGDYDFCLTGHFVQLLNEKMLLGIASAEVGPVT
jgi:hypothetical protein